MQIIRAKSWSISDLKRAVKNSTSYRQVITKLGLIPAGGNYSHVKKYIRLHTISTIHFTGKAWNRGMTGIGKPILTLGEILVKNSHYQSFKLKKRLFAEGLKKPRCELCHWSKKTIDGRLPLELDHVNGDRYDNRIDNLRILCPNCHSLQSTHRGLNRKKK